MIGLSPIAGNTLGCCRLVSIDDPTNLTVPLPTTPEPEAEPAPPRRAPRVLKLVAVVLGTMLLVGVPSAIALVVTLNRGTGDELAKLVPANTDIYATVLLDPSLTQKRNLQSVLERFPQFHTDQDIRNKIDSGLEDAFKSSGLDYRNDVAPWLGSQMALVADIGTKQQSVGFLLRTRDEHAAAAAFDKLAHSDPGAKSDRWTTASFDGATTHLATKQSGADDGGYAVFNGTVFYASSKATLDGLVDAATGRTANLASLAGFKQVQRDLPADNLGIVYVNAASLVHTLKAAMGGLDTSSLPPSLQDAMNALDAYQSLGLTVSLQPNAVAMDTVIETDAAKLPLAMRQQLAKTPARTAMLDWIPQDSFGLLASSASSSGSAPLPLFAVGVIAGLTVIGTQVDTSTPPSDSSSSPSSDTLTQALQQLGLTGPDGLAGKLTGDAALFVNPPTSSSLPVSAVAVLGTNDPQAVEGVLQKLGTLLTNGGQLAQWQDQKDGAVDIHYLDLSAQAGVLPAYAMVDGYAVIGTDPAAVRHAVDAHRGVESSITASPVFKRSGAAGATGSLFFLDLQGILGVVDNNLPAGDRANFDKNVAPDLKPLKTLTVTSSGDERHQSSHLVVILG